MDNFFTIAQTNEVPLIVDELKKQHFEQLEPAGEGHLFIDKINRNFWFCSQKSLETNVKFVEDVHKEKVQQLTLNTLQSWAS